MQHSEKKPNPISPDEYLRTRLLQTVRTLPRYKPLEQFSSLQVEATLCRLGGIDVFLFRYEDISSMLSRALMDLEHYRAVKSVAEQRPLWAEHQEEMFLGLIAFFDWMSALGIRPYGRAAKVL